MAKNKKKRSRQSLMSKAINVGLIALGFARPLQLLLAGQWGQIVHDATFGFADNPQTGAGGGKFRLEAGLRMYSPAAAAVGLGYLKSYLMRKFPVRR